MMGADREPNGAVDNLVVSGNPTPLEALTPWDHNEYPNGGHS